MGPGDGRPVSIPDGRSIALTGLAGQPLVIDGVFGRYGEMFATPHTWRSGRAVFTVPTA